VEDECCGPVRVYVNYIHTTPEKLWSVLTDDVEFMQQYWPPRIMLERYATEVLFDRPPAGD
jgi:hypothetical protein